MPATYRYKVGCDLPGKYRVALDSDATEFGGLGRVRNMLYISLVLLNIQPYDVGLVLLAWQA